MIINFANDTIEDAIQKANEELKAYGLVYTQTDSSPELAKARLEYSPCQEHYWDDLGEYRLEKIND